MRGFKSRPLFTPKGSRQSWRGYANCLIQTVFRNFTPLSRDEKSPLSPSIFLVLVGKTAEWKLSSNRLEPCF